MSDHAGMPLTRVVVAQLALQRAVDDLAPIEPEMAAIVEEIQLEVEAVCEMLDAMETDGGRWRRSRERVEHGR